MGSTVSSVQLRAPRWIAVTWLDCILKDFIDSVDLLVLGGMQNNNKRTDETQCASDAAQMTELFFQKVGSKDGTGEKE